MLRNTCTETPANSGVTDAQETTTFTHTESGETLQPVAQSVRRHQDIRIFFITLSSCSRFHFTLPSQWILQTMWCQNYINPPNFRSDHFLSGLTPDFSNRERRVVKRAVLDKLTCGAYKVMTSAAPGEACAPAVGKHHQFWVHDILTTFSPVPKAHGDTFNLNTQTQLLYLWVVLFIFSPPFLPAPPTPPFPLPWG